MEKDEHHCNKEKEIAEMAIKIDNVEKTVARVEVKTDKLIDKFDGYIDSVPKIYAKKDDVEEKVKATKTEFDLRIKMIERQNGFLAKNWDKIIYMICLIIVGMITLNK